jgi:hypothetical protein
MQTTTMQWEVGGTYSTCKTIASVRLFFELNPYRFHHSEVLSVSCLMYTTSGPVTAQCAYTPEDLAMISEEFDQRRAANDKWLGGLVEALCLGKKSETVGA